MTAEVVRIRSIRRVLKEFLDWRVPTLEPEGLEGYRHALASFEGSINQHASRSLEGVEKRVFKNYYVPGKGYRRRFSEVFGPEKIPAEIHYFLNHSLYRDASTETLEWAPTVVADLCSWLVWKDYVAEEAVEEVIDGLGVTAVGSENSVNF